MILTLLVRNHTWTATVSEFWKVVKKMDEKCPAHVNFAMGRPQALQFTAELGFGEKPWGSRGWASVLGNST